MKNKLIKLLSRPKIIIPIFIVIGLIFFIIVNRYVGEAPIVHIDSENSLVSESGDIIDLSFTRAGRLEAVLASVGQNVHKGDVLAKISAPDLEGIVTQTKGSLDLAQAEYASLNSQYLTTKKQQDLIVDNAYKTLLSGGLEGVPSKQSQNSPIISGTYNCKKEGIYKIKIYASSDNDSGYSFNYSGLEEGTTSIKFTNPIPLGDCGLQIKWNESSYFDNSVEWMIEIPNKKSPTYLANKNAYELAIANREKVLADLSTTISGGKDSDASVANAKVLAARGAYEAALGNYENSFIKAPFDGVVTYIDKNLKVGQSVSLSKSVISIKLK